MARLARERFVDATAASLPSADPRAGARMVLALASGLLLHHLSAPEAVLDEQAPGFLLAAGVAAMMLPGLPVEE